MSATDRPTDLNAACAHKQTTHLHGTHACYVLDRCRCGDCRTSNTRYERSRVKWLAGATPHPYVDAEPVRNHLRQFIGSGMSTKRISELTGVAHGGIAKLVYGDRQRGQAPSKRITRVNAAKLLACPYDVADGAKVPAVEAKAIVVELIARGWAKAEIGRRVHGPHAKSLQAARTGLVMAGTLRTLRRLLVEPVPKRVHNPTGRLYEVRTNYVWREIPASTPGVPSAGGVVRLMDAKRLLRCEVCALPLVDHPITRRCA